MEDENIIDEPEKEKPQEEEHHEPTIEDLKINLEASTQVIDDLKKSNDSMTKELHDLKVELAKLTLQSGNNVQLNDGDIFGAFNKYKK